jgi:hypothetical protein
MISARYILSCIQESADISYGPRPVLYSRDPSSLSQALVDLKDDIRDPVLEFKKDPLLRFLYDPRKDVLKVWCAYRATHDRFEGSGSGFYVLGTVNASDKMYTTESEHPNYYPALDQTFPKLASFIRGLRRTENLFDLY